MTPSPSQRRKFLIISIGLFSLFSLLVVQFYRIQITHHKKWTRLAAKQHVGLVELPFKRGTFWSNVEIKKGHPEQPQPLVMDIPRWHLHIDPASIPEKYRHEIADKLSALSGATDIEGEFARVSRNRRLAMWLDRDCHDQIHQWWLPFARKHKIARNAVFFVKDFQRSYPFGKLLGQALHTIRDRRDETTKQGIPTGGLESRFNDLLKGKMGKKMKVRTPRHRLDGGRVIAPPEDGADIYLTVNHYLQAICEEEVERGVKRSKAKGGWAVMMEPRTGEILAYAQYPFFYPDKYREYFNDPDKAEHAVVKGLTFAYEPGSVMKAITMTIALLANQELDPPLFSPEEKVAVRLGKLPGRKKLLKDMGRHHYLNMNMAIQKSSNIYMARMMQRVVERLGDQWYRDTLHDVFGLGERTGVQLPGEAHGFLPTPGKTYASGAPQWSAAAPYSLAMGYNLLVNSFQMVRICGMIANGGKFVQPTIVRKIVKGDEVLYNLEEDLRDNPPEQRLPPAICDRIIEAMKFTTKPGGTARRADIHGYTEVGKTGTTEKVFGGQYSKTINFTTFIGFTPAKDPEFVLFVAIDEPSFQLVHGGTCAAPVFREIAKRSLDYLGTPLDDPYGYNRQDPRYDKEKADWVKETEQLREMYEEWNITS